jgi:hypothetical protein
VTNWADIEKLPRGSYHSLTPSELTKSGGFSVLTFMTSDDEEIREAKESVQCPPAVADGAPIVAVVRARVKTEVLWPARAAAAVVFEISEPVDGRWRARFTAANASPRSGKPSSPA